ncbi:MAG: hypothetical protein C4326_06750 [Ignavibacteria bacterium]
MKVLMLFLDGVGIGEGDAGRNPFLRADLPALRSLLSGNIPTRQLPALSNGKATLVALDATLGVDGLPQSGTGQTALFTGANAARMIGKHFGPYPYSTLRPLIAERNMFRQLQRLGHSAYFANAYPRQFFDYIRERQSRLTVTTLSCGYAAMPLHTFEDLQHGRAISADITNAGWARMGYDIASISPEEAGKRLVGLSREYDFVLFEYWRTDKAGHAQSMSEAVATLELFDRMLSGVLETLPVHDTLLLITSDHGNMEDLSIKVHTRNPVPAILYGRDHRRAAERLARTGDLTAVTPMITGFVSETLTTAQEI